MTDAASARVSLERCAPSTLLRLELWGDRAAVDARAAETWGAGLPAACRSVDLPAGRLLWIEPDAFLLRTTSQDAAGALAQLETVAGEDAAATDITGALARFRLTGPGWRELLTIGAVFDVEDPSFGPGRTAATVMHHAAIWIDAISDDVADVYCLPSYAEELCGNWIKAIDRIAPGRSLSIV